MAKEYNANSIKSLDGLEHIKARPSMYVGSVDNRGYHHLIWEILDNSIDEFTEGHCSKIDVVVDKDDVVTICDNGRGIPIDINKQKNMIALDMVFTCTNTGGKFDKDSYSYSAGLHGVGASVTNALSDWLEVYVWKKNECYYRRYEDTKKTQEKLQKVKDNSLKNGTKVTFKPNNKIFKKCYFEKDIIYHRLKESAFLNKGLEISFIWHDEKKEVFKFENGLIDFVNYLSKGNNLLQKPTLFEKDFKDSRLEFCFAYDDKFDSNVRSFTNGINNIEGGTHLNSVTDSLSKVILQQAMAFRLIKDVKIDLNKSDVIEGLNLVVKAYVKEPQFEGQTKTRLNNQEERESWGNWVIEELTSFFKKEKELSKLIATKIVEAYKARDVAKKAKNIIKKSKSDFAILPGKLADCSSNNPELCEIHFCEGDSAAGNLKLTRDKNFQAVLPLRGKFVNVQKSSLNKCLENEEIKNIITALGVKITSREVILDGLRYDKIIFDGDADTDGGHICCLFIAFFFKYMRSIIEEGKLYICETPLYKIVYKGKSYYLMSDEELEEFQEKNKGNMTMVRFKGLGEMTIDQLYDCSMNLETRRLKKIYIEDAIMANEVLDKLMGDDIVGRKQFLSDNLIF